MSKVRVGVNFIDRVTGKTYTPKILISDQHAFEFKFKSDMFQYTDVFDFKIPLPKDAINDVKSHDFVEFYYEVNRKQYQIGVGYIEDFFEQETPTELTITGNGKDFLGHLLDVPFPKVIHSENSTLDGFVNRAGRGDYIEAYARLKKKAGFIRPVNNYKGNFLAVSDSTQTRGQVLKKYADLCLNLVYQDHLGRAVIRGRKLNQTPVGTIEKGAPRIINMGKRNRVSNTYSTATVYYTAAEALVDGEAPGHTVKNTDKRVVGTVTRPLFETLNAQDIHQFAGSISAKKRIDQIATHKIRTSNRELNQIVISTDLPFFFESKTGFLLPYRLGDVWDIKSNKDEFKTAKHPRGTNIARMTLTGIDVRFGEQGFNVELSFHEEDTLV